MFSQLGRPVKSYTVEAELPYIIDRRTELRNAEGEVFVVRERATGSAEGGYNWTMDLID